MKEVVKRSRYLMVIFLLSITGLGWTEEKLAVSDLANQYAIFEPTLTCEEANRIAHRSVERLGYQVTTFTPASAAKVGEIKGVRPGTWGEQEPVTVKITCGADGAHVDARADIPPCEQANRISRLAVENLGYKITEFTPATIGKPGLVKGERQGQAPVVITLFCDGTIVSMETRTDSPLLNSKDFYTALSDFRRGFFAMFKAERSVVAPQKASMSSNQVQVTMKPLTQAETTVVFGVAVTQVLPVQVEIINPTRRPYLLETEKIVLVSISGERVKPVNEKESILSAQALTNQTLTPGTTLQGYLYYPPGSYTGARGSLVEEKTQEREGFEVQFQ